MKKYLTILLVFVLFSCWREIDYEMDDVEHQLVVSAFIQPGVADSMLLTSTLPFRSSMDYLGETPEYKGISGAQVFVLSEGDTVGQYVEAMNKSYHYTGNNFEEDKEYELKINHPDYPSVTASTKVPVVPGFWFGTYQDNNQKVKKIPDFSFGEIQVLLEFEDDKTTNNYYIVTAASSYELKFKVGWPEERDSIVVRTQPEQMNSPSPIIEITSDGKWYEFVQLKYDWETFYTVSEKCIVFSDKVFNGQKVSIPVDLQLSGDRYTTKVHLTLTAISEEYYQMLRSLIAYKKSEGGVFPEAFQLYGNVTNGQGVWGAKSSKTVSLDVNGMNLFTNE